MLDLNSTHFLMVAMNKVVLYQLTDPTNAKRTDYRVPDELNSFVTEFVDGTVENGRLYLLDAKSGLAVLPLTNLQNFTLVEITFGRNVKLEVANRTIEVICEYHKTLFVVEVLVRGDRYILNRFYNQIADIKDVDFYNDRAIFIGQHELLVLSHSVNRNALLNLTQQYMASYPSFGFDRFEVMRPYSNDQSAVLIGVSYEEAIVLKVQQKPPLLRCDFTGISSGTYTYLVEIQSTFCGTGTYHEWQDRYNTTDVICRIRYPIVFKFSIPFQEKSRNIISVTSLALWLALILVILGLAAKWGTQMNGIMRSLRDEILKKRNSNQSRGTLGSTVNMLRNPI